MPSGERGLDRARLTDEAERAWESLPPDSKEALREIIGSLPEDLKGWRGLIDGAVDQLRQALGERSRVAIIGPVNAGKSTLYNQLTRRGQARAAVSAVPGTTREAQMADAGIFLVVDTPGADAVGAVGVEERERAFAACRQADVLVALFDAAHGVRGPESALMGELRALGKPMVVALNKMDLVSRSERAEVLGRAAAGLGIDSIELLALSAERGEGLETLLLAVARAEPAIVAALGAALPGYRWTLTQGAIARAASTAAVIAVTPLPILDFIPLLGVQAAMVLSVARIYNYKLTLARARELVVTLGAGLLGRTLFYELSKFGGPPGWLVAAGVAVGTTAALGYSAAIWFDRGTKISAGRRRAIGRAVAGTVIERLKDIGRGRPSRKSLRRRIDEALEDMPLPAEEQAAKEEELTGGGSEETE